jgi:brefeldin A-resistance guanine nucleotide exchange factor 1
MRRSCEFSVVLPAMHTQLGHRYLDVEALVAAIRALEALAHERTVARLKQESDEPNAPPTNTLSYDPVSVFLLEAMVSIACQTPQHIEEVW